MDDDSSTELFTKLLLLVEQDNNDLENIKNWEQVRQVIEEFDQTKDATRLMNEQFIDILTRWRPPLTASDNDGHDQDQHQVLKIKAIVALDICSKRPVYGARLLTFVERVLLQLKNPISIGEILTALTCSLTSLTRFLYNVPSMDSLDLWKILCTIKDSIADELVLKKEHAGIIIRGARALQSLVMLWSKPGEEEEGEEPEVKGEIPNLSDLPREHFLRASSIRDEGVKTLDKLISVLWKEPIASNILLAVVNLLGRVARRRPVFLPKIIPALIDLFESPPVHLLDNQRIFLLHTLERQLASLIESSAAEKYYPLIVEVLKKANKSNNKKRSNQENSSSLVEVEDEEDASLASVGTKKLKAEEPIAIDLTRIPLNVAAEIVTIVLRTRIVESQLRVELERWRPTPIVRDPRRAPVMTEAPIEVQVEGKVDNDNSQVVPFELAPIDIIDPDEQSQLLLGQFRFLLESLGDLNIIQNAKKRKAKLKSFLRLANLLISLGAEDLKEQINLTLITFCFENLDELMSILLYWLRLLWVQESNQLYNETFTSIMSHLQEAAQENNPQWEIHLQHFLSKVPLLVEDQHLTLLNWLSTSPATRIMGLEIVEKLSKSRPSLTNQLITLLLGYCKDPDEALRKAALVIICDSLLSSQSGELVLSLAKSYMAIDQSQVTIATSKEEEEGGGGGGARSYGVLMDLPLRLLIRKPETLTSFLESYNNSSKGCQEYCISQLILLAPLLDVDASKKLLPILASVSINSDSVEGLFMEKLVEALCRSGKLTLSVEGEEEETANDPFFINISSGKWPVRLLESLISIASKTQLQMTLPQYITYLDPGDEANRTQYTTLLAKAVERMGPVEVFVFLHQMEGSIPLKRCIDAIQLCFILTAIFKPEVLASGLARLLELPTLPTTLMRSFMQAVATHRSLAGYVVGLLSRLIQREIWKVPKLWDGYVRCIKNLAPSSHAVMLQLPLEQLEELLKAAPELKPGFSSYLKQQSSSVQSRYSMSLFR